MQSTRKSSSHSLGLIFLFLCVNERFAIGASCHTHVSLGSVASCFRPLMSSAPPPDASLAPPPPPVQQQKAPTSTGLPRVLFEEVCAELNLTATEREALLHPEAVTAFYFSASWCNPCKAFTPLLSSCYEIAREEDNVRIEVIYVSGDANEETFTAYREKMPWKRFSIAPDSARQAKRSDLTKAFRGWS
jgi:thiol-disulfide isomerase/thioredoxin